MASSNFYSIDVQPSSASNWLVAALPAGFSFVPTVWYFWWASVASTSGDLSALVIVPLLLIAHLLSIANAFAWVFAAGKTWVETLIRRSTLSGWFVVAGYVVFLLTRLSLTGVLFN